MNHPAFSDIGACVFDAYGTLFDVHSAVARGGATLGDKAQGVSDLWRQKQLEYTWLRSLMDAHVDFWQVTSEGLDYALAAHGIDDAALKESLMSLYLTLDAYPDVPACLDALRAGGKATAILSNGAPRMLEAAVASAGLTELLDKVLSIETVGIYKPDRRVYQLAVDALDTEAGRICFVSTNAWDASGAAHFGFRVAWLNRFGKQPDRLPGEIRGEITTLADLPGLLGL
ncbi:MAG: haloacid dehalogenase type II [Rhodospirillales bacterium]|nr:haloacid dehalogenase type II [Rhodospirillales bacterium]MDH3791823.1 haloacid dehalogenase type II [Rhodospirillales bacterium]MDH3911627.1 haloacid dehalogenase type II [Rhodospirillales bacterium]MDH3919528.1 haloacid dehalogenase type II [Rhodospirillales bacterium]